MAPKKKDLFENESADSSSSSDDSSSSSEDNNDLRLTVNKKFATKYQTKKEQEELAQIRQRKQRDGITDLSSESDSSDEEEDEDGELFTPSVNVQFLKTIKALRKKDESIYDPKSQFFDEPIQTDADDAKTKTRKPQKYKDVLREQILEQMKSEDATDSLHIDESKSNSKSRSKLGYNQEQDELRKAFLKESANDEDNDEDWMVVKKKTKSADLDKLEKEASEELKEIEQLSKGEGDVFKDPRGEVGDGEQFLLDFITNKKWIDHNDIGRDDEESSLDDVERADEYESNFNFRFEQAAEEAGTSGASLSVQTYARSQTMNTVRREDTSRKDKRQARKERKAAERKAKEEQLKRLKNAKKKEMNQKLSQVRAVIGDTDENAIDEAAIMKMLEGDYDPEKFEKAMEQAYGDDFYEQEDKEWKTDLDVRKTLNADEDGNELVGLDDVNGGMYDNFQDGEYNEDGMDEENYDETEEWNDDEYEDTQEESKFEKKLKKKMQEELYKLDYEDIVAGMPTRFKYREVESNDFGLTTQEILFARDTTLKQFVSLKKMAPYNEQGEFHVGSKKRRKFREMLKKDLEDNLPTEEENQEQTGENTKQGTEAEEPKKKRRRLKKGKKKSKEDPSAPTKDDEEVQITQAESQSNGTKKRRRKKSGKKGESSNKDGSNEDAENANDSRPKETKLDAENIQPVESSKSKKDSKKRRSQSNTSSVGGHEKKKKQKKRKREEKASSISGISQSRLASYGL